MSDDDASSPLVKLRKGKRKRTARIIESDQSSSDSSVENVRSKGKKLMRVSSDDSISESDGSPHLRKACEGKALRKISSSTDSDSEFEPEENVANNSSDWESDWSSDSSMESSTETRPIIKTVAALATSSQNAANAGWSSDSSDGHTEKCPICLLSFSNQPIGTPETCDHSFCADCLQEWARNVNTCPVDRLEFSLILVRKCIRGKVVKTIPVETRRPSEEELVEEDPTYCEVCGRCDHEATMLLCDNCDAGYHMECLTPPLDTVPMGMWFCVECADRHGAVTDEVSDEEVQSLREDAQSVGRLSRTRRHTNQARLIPRTRQSERIRANIETHRGQDTTVNRTGAFNPEQPSTSSGFESVLDANAVRPRIILPKRGHVKRRRKRRRARRKIRTVVKEYEICQITGTKMPVKTKVVIRRRRKAHRRKKTKSKRRIKPQKTVKRRLAENLLLCTPKAGKLLPDIRLRTVHGMGHQRHQAGIPTLHLFGQSNQLDYFSDNSDVEVDHYVGSSSVALSSHRLTMPAISEARRLMRRKCGVVELSTTSSPIDLIDDIMKTQAQWHSGKLQATVNIDGSLKIHNNTKREVNMKDMPAFIINQEDKVDINQNINSNGITQAPMHPGSGNNTYSPYGFHSRGSGYQGENSYREPSGNPNDGNLSITNDLNPPSNAHNPWAEDTIYPESTSFQTSSSNDPYKDDPELSNPRSQAQRTKLSGSSKHDEVMSRSSLESTFNDSVQSELTVKGNESEFDLYSDIEYIPDTEEIDDNPISFSNPSLSNPNIEMLPPIITMPSNENIQSDSEMLINDSSETTAISLKSPVSDSSKLQSPNRSPKIIEITSNELQIDILTKYETTNIVSERFSLEKTTSEISLNDTNIIQEDSNTLAKSQNEDCPNLSIYSVASMNIARSTDTYVPDINVPVAEEHDEELVQLTGSIEFERPIESVFKEDIDVSCIDSLPVTNNLYDSRFVDPNPSVPDTDSENKCVGKKSCVDDSSGRNQHKSPKSTIVTSIFPPSKRSFLELYDDSDWEEWNNEKTDEEKTSTIPTTVYKINKLTESISDIEDERSYTPCQDEEGKSKLVFAPPNVMFDSEEKYLNIGVGGIEGLETELISEEEENVFDEDQSKNNMFVPVNVNIENKAVPEDYEEGEIVERRIQKENPKLPSSNDECNEHYSKKGKNVKVNKMVPRALKIKTTKKDSKQTNTEDNCNKVFKKINKSGKDRNYRDKDKILTRKAVSRSKSKERDSKKFKSSTKDTRKREKRKDIERYDVRNVVGDRPRKLKDPYGRDTSRPRSMSRSKSRSIGRSRLNRSSSKHRQRSRVRRSLSRTHRSRSRGRDHTDSRVHRSRSLQRRHRSLSKSSSRSPSGARLKNKTKGKKSRDSKKRKLRSTSRSPSRNRGQSRQYLKSKIKKGGKGDKKVSRSKSPPVNKLKTWISSGEKRRSRSRSKRGWSSSWSSLSPTPDLHKTLGTRSISPSWTPPVRENHPHNAENLRVILKNKEVIKSKKKDKKKKTDTSKTKENNSKYKKQKRGPSEQTPCKEVFASGDNILVSVSFNKKRTEEKNNTLTSAIKEPLSTKRKHTNDENDLRSVKRTKKTIEKNKSPFKRIRRSRIDMANNKPVAIIDLDKSPFKELTPSPKAVIILSDSDAGEKEEDLMERQEMLREELMEMASNQGDSQPESPALNDIDSFLNSTTGPKTPPEPQIKFSIPVKPQTKLRSINPLHETEDDTTEMDDNNDMSQNILETRLHEMIHKGPNTPPEPPNSPPSSPDAYDPFEPTKSGSESPEPTKKLNQEKQKSGEINDANQQSLQNVDNKINPCDEIDSQKLVLNSNTVEQVITLLASTYTRSPDRQQIPSVSPHETPKSNSDTGSMIGSQLLTSDPGNNQSPELPKNSNLKILGNVLVQSNMLPAVIKPIPKSMDSLAYTSVVPMASTPLNPHLNVSRLMFNTSTGLPPRIGTAIPQRLVAPSPSKNSPIKPLLRPSPIKSSPIKPMLSKTVISKLPLPNTKMYAPLKNLKAASVKHTRKNGNDINDSISIESPYSPGSSDYGDLFEPPADNNRSMRSTGKSANHAKSNANKTKTNPDTFDSLFGTGSPTYKNVINSKSNSKKSFSKNGGKHRKTFKGTKTQVGVKMDDDQLKILEELPSSAVEMQVKDKFLKKLNRQERVVEEVKLVLKPHYNKKHISKEEYKDVLRRAVPKICHNKTGEINPQKIHGLIEAYVKKVRHGKKSSKP